MHKALENELQKKEPALLTLLWMKLDSHHISPRAGCAELKAIKDSPHRPLAGGNIERVDKVKKVVGTGMERRLKRDAVPAHVGDFFRRGEPAHGRGEKTEPCLFPLFTGSTEELKSQADSKKRPIRLQPVLYSRLKTRFSEISLCLGKVSHSRED